MNLDGYKLVFEDDFKGDKLNTDIWTPVKMCQPGHGGSTAWRLPENVTVEDDSLVITGLIEEDGMKYTSGMVNTSKSLCYKYGYAEIRAKLPKGGKGIWPGFWMKSDYKGSNVNSEVDVFEMFGDSKTIACNIHAWWKDNIYGKNHHINFLDGQGIVKKKTLDNDAKFCDDFHTIGYMWTPEKVEFCVDGEPYCSVNIENPVFAAFHTPIYFIISMAFGLTFLSRPDETTPVPVKYCIDYIKLYQNEDGVLYNVNEDGSISERK